MRWEVAAETLEQTWGPDAPHFSVWGQTRVAGKSHFKRYGLMPLVPNDRVLVIDNKGGDPTWRGWGKDIGRLKKAMFRREGHKPRDGHYRLVLPRKTAEARAICAEALERCFTEGEWVIVLDEGRAITDPRAPNLNLRPAVDELFLRGGSRGLMLVHGSQAPRWCTSCAYSECAHSAIGRTRDAQVHQRLQETSGFTRELVPTLAALQRHEFLLISEGGDVLMITKAPPK